MKKVLLTGATGLIGTTLSYSLIKEGYKVIAVARNKSTARTHLSEGIEIIECQLANDTIKSNLIENVDIVINLLGESIASGRWTPKQKEELYNSRILTTRNLIRSFKTAPKVFISGSAIGIYGDRADEQLSENSSTGNDFLAQLCANWEVETKKIFSLHDGIGSRVINLRTGLVLSAQGGALKKMLSAFHFGLGGNLGDGQQWMSWIHIDDLVRMILFFITNSEASGAINAVSPNPVKNSDFTDSLVKTLHGRRGPSIPKFALKLLFGEMSTVLLSSQKVSCGKIQKLGFQFQYGNITEAFGQLLK